METGSEGHFGSCDFKKPPPLPGPVSLSKTRAASGALQGSASLMAFRGNLYEMLLLNARLDLIFLKTSCSFPLPQGSDVFGAGFFKISNFLVPSTQKAAAVARLDPQSG